MLPNHHHYPTRLHHRHQRYTSQPTLEGIHPSNAIPYVPSFLRLCLRFLFGHRCTLTSVLVHWVLFVMQSAGVSFLRYVRVFQVPGGPISLREPAHSSCLYVPTIRTQNL